jgi:CheY-like chemotaxis protein/HPt (histidine-containing phosphotransfer) domain-containing protein
MARILVVEDNPANMKLACLLLRNAGHTALCAIDAETGLTLARTDQPDLILMDIQLPGMDGLAATALLKQDPATAGIPVIALTAMAMKADQEKTRVAGCDAYIAKPLRYQELFAVIDSLLDKRDPAETGKENLPHHAPACTSLQNNNEAGFNPPSREKALRQGRLILVAEDNETNQRVILRQLALLGFAADVAGNGHMALQRWQSSKYALLLTDLQMPEMDGFELIEAVRAQERSANRVPIVIMTASTSKREIDRYRTPDMDGYLSKPLQMAELKAALDRWLPPAGHDQHPINPAGFPSAAAQALDVSVLERLVGSDPVVIQEFLDGFRTSAMRIALDLKSACANRQAAQAADQAHKLMSSARAVGALALGDLCAELETAGKAGSLETLTMLLPRFEQELDTVNMFLDFLRASSRTTVTTTERH